MPSQTASTATAASALRHPGLVMAPPRSYWQPELLHGFTLLMAGHGLCVCESMMLGDAAYTRAQLRHACVMDDQALQQLAVEMLSALGHGVQDAATTSQWSH